MDRSVIGSWLQGPRAASGAGTGYPGERLGLPAEGRGSVAGFGPRFLAFVVDAVMSNLVALALLALTPWDPGRGSLVFWVFAGEVFLLTWLQGASAGQRLRGLRVVRLDGRPLGPVGALMRTLLLCLLVPALITDRDGRGLHDKAARTVLVRV